MVAKNKHCEPLQSSVEALEIPGKHKSTPDLVLRQGTVDRECLALESQDDRILERKEWQANMGDLVALTKKAGEEFPTIPVDERASGAQAIRED